MNKHFLTFSLIFMVKVFGMGGTSVLSNSDETEGENTFDRLTKAAVGAKFFEELRRSSSSSDRNGDEVSPEQTSGQDPQLFISSPCGAGRLIFPSSPVLSLRRSSEYPTYYP